MTGRQAYFRPALIVLDIIAFLAAWSITRTWELTMWATGDIALSPQIVGVPIAIIVALNIWFLATLRNED